MIRSLVHSLNVFSPNEDYKEHSTASLRWEGGGKAIAHEKVCIQIEEKGLFKFSSSFLFCPPTVSSFHAGSYSHQHTWGISIRASTTLMIPFEIASALASFRKQLCVIHTHIS